MGSRLESEVFARAEVDDLGDERLLVDHDVVWLEVSMQDLAIGVEVVESLQQLPHDDLDLVLLIELVSIFLASLADILGEAHVHLFEDQVQASIFVLDPLGLHHKRAVTLVDCHLVEPLQDLHLSLFKRLFLGRELGLKPLDGVFLGSLNVGAGENLSETP